MRRVTSSPLAKADLRKIARYIARDSQAAALRFLDDIDGLTSKIAMFPGMGRSREDLFPGMRSIPLGNYLVFYLIRTDKVQIMRVLHGMRDVRREFT